MVRGILGKKVGMTQIFDDDGRAIPVTVVEAGPCVIVQRKSLEKDGYEAVQIGLVEKRPRRNVPKPIIGHFAAAGVPPTRFVAEVPVDTEDEAKPGDAVLADIFAADDSVHVVGKSKGRGFQGVISAPRFQWRTCQPRLDVPPRTRVGRSFGVAVAGFSGTEDARTDRQQTHHREKCHGGQGGC